MKAFTTGMKCAAIAAAASMSFGATAQGMSSGPVTIVVPFAAGGPTDVVARVLAKGLGEELRQAVVVENKGGAGGRLGIGILKNAKPDGLTIGMATASTQSVAPNLYTKLNYDPIKDFKSIGQVVDAPGVLISPKSFVPDCKLSTFISKLKEAPGKYTYGSSGVGGLSHLSGEHFLSVTKTQMLHVPYQGIGPAMNDLFADQIVAIFDNISSAMGHIKSGKVCALAVQSKGRLSDLQSIPTYAELGFPELNNPTWYGLIAPKGVPDQVIVKLNRALNAALKNESIKKTFAGLGVQPSPMTPEEFTQAQLREMTMWKDIVAQSKIAKLD